jgi:hypothetical protein
MSDFDQRIYYGDNDELEFPFNKLDVDTQPVYASDGIQQEGLAYTFAVSGMLVGDTPAELVAQICDMKRYLGTRGLRFKVVQDDGYTPVVVYQIDSNLDVRWGPHPGPVHFTRFAGGIAASYTWSLYAVCKECFLPGGTCGVIPFSPSALIISLTTKWDHHIDESGQTTRSVSGKLRIKSGRISSTPGYTADSFRGFCQVPIPQFYRQTSLAFSCSEDGTELTWSQSMQEMCNTLPNPITAGDADFSIRLQDTGLLAYYSLSGFFEAPITISPLVILQCISDLLDSKIGTTLTTTNPAIPITQEITHTKMYERNRFSFSFTGTFGIQGQAGYDPNFYAPLFKTLTTDPPNSTGVSKYIGPYGGDKENPQTAMLPYFTNDACESVLKPMSGAISPTTDPASPSQYPQSSFPVPQPGGQTTADHLADPYIAYHEEVHYDLDNGIVAFYPKKSAVGPVFQQTSNPVLRVIQAGYAVRYASDSQKILKALPMPIISQTKGNGVVRESSIIPSSPEPIGTGSFQRYTIHWRYVMESASKLLSSSGGSAALAYNPEIAWPNDPRINTLQKAITGIDAVEAALGVVTK